MVHTYSFFRCCIDKASSQELSEAINSMFQWYWDSSVCYAYLQDYVSDTLDAASLEKSEWLYRGWTLQELIAPRKLVFYNKSWHCFGSKSDQNVCEVVSYITKIDVEFLLGSDLESASIAKRMSWASKRKTSRSEDIAYCLMGLFDINMPLLYGEGPKAFKRLQEEIIKQYPEDHSLYAWGVPVDKCSIEVSRDDTFIRENIDDQFASSEPLSGLLANSPQDFEYSRNYSPITDVGKFYAHFWEGWTPANYPMPIGKGIRIELFISNNTYFYYQFSEPSVSQVRPGIYAILLCKDDTDDDVTPCIPLLRGSSGCYSRVRELHLDRTLRLSQRSLRYMLPGKRSTLTVTAERKPKLRNGDIILRFIWVPSTNSMFFFNYDHRATTNDYNVIQFKQDLLIRGVFIKILDASGNSGNWAIALARIQTENHDFPAFQAGIVALCGPNIDMLREEFIYEKVFQSPSDEVTFDLDSLFQIAIRVNRRPLSDRREFIDIVDIAVKDTSTQAAQAAQAAQATNREGSNADMAAIDSPWPSDTRYHLRKRARK